MLCELDGTPLLDGESNAGFIVTAMRLKIARRQLKGSGEKSPDFFTGCRPVEQIGVKAANKPGRLVAVARKRSSVARPKSQSNHHQRRGVRYYGALLCNNTMTDKN